MSFVDTVTNEKPGKYETIIESRVLAKQLEMKIKQYHSTQDAYDKLIQSETINRKPASGGNENINGRLKQISAAGKDWLWGVNSSDNIFTCKKPCTDSNWKQIPGGLTQIEGGDKEVWGVNSVNNIYKTNQDGTGGWTNIPGKLTNISQGGGWVWGVNSSHNVYRCKDPCDGNWVLDSSSDTTPPGVKNLLKPNEYLTSNKYLVSDNKAFFLIMQSDGNLVVYKGSGPSDNKGALWSSGTSGKGESFAIMQSDGNFVVYKGSAPAPPQMPTWNSKTSGKGESFAIMQDDGNFVVYKGSGPSDNKGALWNSKTGGNTPPPTSVTPSLVQLSCSNTYVYGLDTNKNAWWKPINGTGSWKRFGNDNQKKWQFYWINASSSNGKILALDMGRIIKETDKNGTAPWKRSSSAGGASGLTTVSADSHNEDFYFTNTNDQIYRNSPITSGGFWTDIKNENYQMGMVSSPIQTNDNWKFLGKSDTLNDCKLKAVEDKETVYSSVVYYPSDFGNDWSKSCFGGIKGKNINSGYQLKTITSLAPNGTSRLGGQEGETLLNQMKKIQGQIKSLIDQSKEDSIGLDKTTNSLNTTRKTTNNELSNLLDKLARDRKKINKLLLEPDAIGEEENSDFLQQTNYSVYFLWILLVIVSLFLASHIIGSPSESISPIAYVFVSIWILIFAKYYYKQAASYGVAFWKYLSTLMIDPL